MGFVYLAKDKNLFDRLCVVKQVRDRLQSKEHREKLEEEALRMSKLNHPNVAMILDHFTEAGYYFLVVEYIRGKTLREVFEERTGPLQEIKVLQWAKSICDVLVYLHAEGVVHRDISPDNIMISSDGSIKFIDFGTLRELQKVAAGGTAGMGKFGFSPPEQWQGKPEPRSDIFALGATLYFLLTGFLPLSNEYLNGQGPQKEDFYPDFAPIRKKNPAISPQLEAILQKALSLDINKRYASASDMLRDLDSLVAKKTKPELGNSNLKGKLSKRQIYAITASIILVVGCIGTGMYYLTSYNRTASPSTTSTTSSLSAAVTTSSPPVTTSSSPVTATTSSPSVTTSSTTSTVTTPPTQPAEPMWYKTFGGTAYDIGRSIIQSADGGFAIVGSTKSYGAGDNDVWLVKTDNNGNKLWDKTFGGTGYDNGYSIIQTADGGFVLLGTTAPSGTNNAAVWLIKTDINGNKLWDKTFGGVVYDQGYSLIQSADGGFAIAGYTTSYGVGGDVWLIKTDSNGNKLWDKTFGGAAMDKGNSIIQLKDGGFVITGSTESYGAGKSDVWLIKTDSNGNKLWDKTFGDTGFDFGNSVIQSSDGGFVIAGLTVSADLWLIKTDSNGNKLWDKTFGGAYADEAYSILQSGDGGFVITGETNPPTFRGYDVWLIKTDNNGNKLWDKTFGGVNDDGGYSVIQTSDGGFVIAGYTGWIVTSADSTGDLLVIKTDSTGTSLPGPATSSVTTTPPSTTPSTTPVATTTPPAAGTNVIDVWPTSGTSIQTTVNGAKSGDTIIVHSGTYHEAVVFSGNSGITLKGDGAILDGSSFLSGRGIITIQNGATNITVTGFQIIKSGEDGIWLGDANGCSISQNQISNSRNGIIINNARDNNISNNTITNSSFYGIQACLCNGNNIENNVINGNSNGISTSGTNNHILQNQITESADDSRGILVNSGLNDLANGNTVEKNIVKSNGMGIIIVGSTNQLLSNQVSSVYDGIYICFDTINNIDSKDNLIQQNKITCTHNGNSAINLVCVHNNIILQNEISNSWYGITMFGIMNNIHYVVGGNHISQNKITNSIYEGIAAWDEAVGNTIENNEVSGSGIYDLFDVSTTSPLNTWVNNTYNKKNW